MQTINDVKESNLSSYAEYEKTQPIVIHCESCGHKVTSYEPLPKCMPCPGCEKEIDLR